MPELSVSGSPAGSWRRDWPQSFSCDRESDGSSSVWLRLAGELDLSDCPQLRRALIEAGERVATIAVDLHGLTFIDCAGIATLFRAATEARRRGGDLSLLGASGQVERVLELTGVPADAGQLEYASTGSPRTDSPCWQGR